MSSLSPKLSKRNRWANIGTRGGSVKPSTVMHLKTCINMLSKFVQRKLKNAAAQPVSIL